MTLPYWDYYKYPRIPYEFTNTATGNSLYVPRTGPNVYNALSLAPFSSTVMNFQRNTNNPFELALARRKNPSISFGTLWIGIGISPPAQLAPDTTRSIRVILEDLQLLGFGAKGGYFYNIYINLPDTIEDGQKYLLGTVGRSRL